MPWTGQVCPFCHIRYANKTGLRNHLLSYTGRLRVPADGIHDVLKIQGLRILKDYFHEDKISYRCPSCAMGISDLRKFKEHVFYRRHYGDGYKDNDKTRPPFDPEIYKIHHSVDPVRGVWLQHNPPVNLLSLLAVNHQVYHEARRVLYLLNPFVFHDKMALCVFLFGIGSHNASLLRSVKWKNDNGQYEDHVDTIKAYMTRCESTAQEPQLKREVNIWNDDDQLVEFLKMIKGPGPGEWGHTYRLLRRDSKEALPTDYFYRYVFNIRCYEGGEARRHVRAAYELCTRAVKRDNPV
ncbi:hypothetical protein PISL3812_08923 [Talaromyces islandicus]|uniref:C2H2-type domain-containing protein n=1 Tax=Talaromyces islandicus TaxID=28573 RepID=A0A0U1M8H5_TALIS|nr:hypothetical protein PISL3812_08923 [Talaromyces islandicus]